MGSSDDSIGDKERRVERLALDAATRLRPNDWSSLEIRMVNLSALGFCANCEARLQTGGCVSLDIPGLGPVEAQVEWCQSGAFGARFLEPIDLARCTWTLRERESSLAQLLVGRAAARRAGRNGAERRLRQQILVSLPMHKGSIRA